MGQVHKLKDIEDRDESFVEEYVANGGNATQAAIVCGVSEASASTVGHRLKNRLGSEIERELRTSLNRLAPQAINRMKELAEQASSEQVRLSANKDLLDRAGYKPTDKSEITTEDKSVKKMTTEEIKASLNDLYQRNGLKPVPISAVVIMEDHPDYERYVESEPELAEFTYR
jgi:phage terminase small subunit